MILKRGLDPVVGHHARILILGTLPGEESLRQQRYYGHPRNIFWRIISDVVSAPMEWDYDRRLAMLKRNRIALWDVLLGAERDGSLDSAIRNEVPNDIARLLAAEPTIESIAFNGLGAAKLFRRHIAPDLTQSAPRLHFATLPSTSPTPSRKALTYQEKLACWKAELTRAHAVRE